MEGHLSLPSGAFKGVASPSDVTLMGLNGSLNRVDDGYWDLGHFQKQSAQFSVIHQISKIQIYGKIGEDFTNIALFP